MAGCSDTTADSANAEGSIGLANTKTSTYSQAVVHGPPLDEDVSLLRLLPYCLAPLCEAFRRRSHPPTDFNCRNSSRLTTRLLVPAISPPSELRAFTAHQSF